jgi:Pectic acid lyase
MLARILLPLLLMLGPALQAQPIDRAAVVAGHQVRNTGLNPVESAGVLLFLMQQPRPTPAMKAAIDAGIAWLQIHALREHVFTMTPDGRELVPQPGTGPLWSRLYDIPSGRPIFGDWGKTIHEDVNEISKGCRNGYTWWGVRLQKALTAYPRWQADERSSAFPSTDGCVSAGWACVPRRPSSPNRTARGASATSRRVAAARPARPGWGQAGAAPCQRACS